MLTLIRFIFRPLWWPPLVLLILSYLGQIHPGGDSLAVFRPYILLALSAVSLILVLAKARFRGFLGLLISGAALFEMALVFQAPKLDHIAGGDTVSVYHRAGKGAEIQANHNGF